MSFDQRRRCSRTRPALVGDPQIRHRGTIGGSVAHADPSADVPTALLALGASYVVVGPNGTRTVAADDFATGFLETVLEPDEMLTEVRVPKPAAGGGYQKFTRRAIDWATVAVAAVQRGDGSVAVALANMGPTAQYVPAASSSHWLLGRARSMPPDSPMREHASPD